MDSDELNELAREAGCSRATDGCLLPANCQQLARFAELAAMRREAIVEHAATAAAEEAIAEAQKLERDACAAICGRYPGPIAMQIARAIRGRESD